MAKILRTNERLNVNQSLISKNGQFELILQQDGNLVLYRRANHQPQWASGTQGRDVSHVVMQEDGNLVIYGYRNEPIWSSDTEGNIGAWLLVHDSGHLILGRPSVVWAQPSSMFVQMRFPDLIS